MLGKPAIAQLPGLWLQHLASTETEDRNPQVSHLTFPYFQCKHWVFRFLLRFLTCCCPCCCLQCVYFCNIHMGQFGRVV